MPKSLAEKERLATNAKNQAILIQGSLRKIITQPITVKHTVSNAVSHQAGASTQVQAKEVYPKDIYQPEGEIDYSRFNRSKKAKK